MLWWLFAFFVAADLASAETEYTGTIGGKRVKPKRATPPRGGLVVFGEGRYWRPAYTKRTGCSDFRFGACFDDWVNIVASKTKGGQAVKDAQDVIIKIVAAVVPGGKAAKWIIENACVRFKFPLERVEDPEGGGAFRVAQQNGAALLKAAPPHPLPPLDGFERVWIHFPGDEDNSLRSPNVVKVLFPDGDLWEILGEAQIRDLLSWRSTDGYIDLKTLASVACGKSRWWWATRKKAMAEWG